jgi:hypothetical protein
LIEKIPEPSATVDFAGHSDRESTSRAFERALKISPDSIAAPAGAVQILYADRYADGDVKAIRLNRMARLRPTVLMSARHARAV